MSYIIKVDGSQTEVEPANGKHFTLQELQAAVGGYIEHLSLPSGQHLYLDEEGKFKPAKLRNERATLLGRSAGIASNDFIVGDVIVVDPIHEQHDED